MQSWNAVIQDMLKRNEDGARKYNRYLDPNVKEDMLQHAYEEALDLAVYLKTQIMRREKLWSPETKSFNYYYVYEA